MKRITLLVFLLFLLLPVRAYALSSSELTETKTETAYGYCITYTQDGRPVFAADKGYATVQRVLEDKRIIEERYFDADGKPVSVSGYHIKRNQYDGGKLVQIAYFDADDRPVKNSSGYAILRREVDDQNHVRLELYYDEAGAPVMLSGGQYGMRYEEYDSKNHAVRFCYVGIDGEPANLTSGYSTVVRTYDDGGRILVERFYTADGEPAVLSLGHSGSEYILNDSGKRVGAIYLDKDGSPMINNQGYGIVRYDYDEWDNITKHSYYDLAGNPACMSRGQYGQVIMYSGKQRLQSYYVDARGQRLFFLDQFLSDNPYAVLTAAAVLLIAAAVLPKRFRAALMCLYVLFILYMTLLVREPGEQRVNFELFWSYRTLFENGLNWDVINNILLFLPLGALIYSIRPKLFFLAPLLSAAVEATQYIGGLGLCELDDIFGNTLGGFLGWLAMRGIAEYRRKHPDWPVRDAGKRRL